MFCFGENVDKYYIKGKIYMCIISFAVSFFSDVHAKQRVVLYALLKYYIVALGILSNRLLLRLAYLIW